MSSLCLQMDVGNSSAKWRLLDTRDPSHILARGIYRSDEPSRDALLACADEVGSIWIASVANTDNEQQLTHLLRQRWAVTPWFARTPAQTGSLVNSYEAPQRMGVDRWLAMLGAQQHADGRFCVVDAGSALTIDIVAASGEHEGGYIIPGPALMERALLLDTDRVRFDEPAEYTLAPGKSTAEAVRHGIALAQWGAVQLVMQREQLSSEQLYLCGGAAPTLHELSAGQGQVKPDLVFEGLTRMAGSEN